MYDPYNPEPESRLSVSITGVLLILVVVGWIILLVLIFKPL